MQLEKTTISSSYLVLHFYYFMKKSPHRKNKNHENKKMSNLFNNKTMIRYTNLIVELKREIEVEVI